MYCKYCGHKLPANKVATFCPECGQKLVKREDEIVNVNTDINNVAVEPAYNHGEYSVKAKSPSKKMAVIIIAIAAIIIASSVLLVIVLIPRMRDDSRYFTQLPPPQQEPPMAQEATPAPAEAWDQDDEQMEVVLDQVDEEDELHEDPLPDVAETPAPAAQEAADTDDVEEELIVFSDMSVYCRALAAFRDFMTTPQYVEIDSWDWSVLDQHRAMLLDFDDDGIPELLLGIGCPIMRASRYLVVTYNVRTGQAEIAASALMAGSFWAVIGEAFDGQLYFISLEGTLNRFLGLRNGVMAELLTTSGGMCYESDETFLFVNDVSAVPEYFDAAPYNYLGIVYIHQISDFGENRPWDLLEYIEGRLS